LTLREARERKGISQRELAAKLNVNQAAVSHWEAGRWPPLKKYHKIIARTLGVPADEIEELKGKEAIK
jgi:transcriptional regulator with XRE-family HTH domain